MKQISKTISILLVIGAIFFASVYLYNVFDKVRIEHEKNFTNNLFRLIEKSKIVELKDVYDLYYGEFKPLTPVASNIQEISNLLKGSKSILWNQERTTVNNQVEQKILNRINELIKQIEIEVKKRVALKPFADTPQPERSIIEDIYENSDIPQKQYLKDKLKKLGSALRIRQETIEQLNLNNKESLSYSIYGLVGTIAFSLASIALALFAFYQNKNFKKQLNEIKILTIDKLILGKDSQSILSILEKKDIIQYLKEDHKNKLIEDSSI